MPTGKKKTWKGKPGRPVKQSKPKASPKPKPIKARKTKPAKKAKLKASAKRKAAIPARWQDRSEGGKDGLGRSKQAVKSAKDWDRRGNNLGKRIEGQFNQFGEEMEKHGKRLEKHGKRFETKARPWWYSTFGPVGPIIKSLINIAIIGIAVFFIGIMNGVLLSAFVDSLALFIMDYIPVFFIIFLFFNYIKYFYYISPKSRYLLRPLEVAGGITVMLWLLAWVFLLAHQSADIGIFQRAANWIFPNTWNIFVIVLAIAYLGAIIVHSQKRISDNGRKQ